MNSPLEEAAKLLRIHGFDVRETDTDAPGGHELVLTSPPIHRRIVPTSLGYARADVQIQSRVDARLDASGALRVAADEYDVKGAESIFPFVVRHDHGRDALVLPSEDPMVVAKALVEYESPLLRFLISLQVLSLAAAQARDTAYGLPPGLFPPRDRARLETGPCVVSLSEEGPNRIQVIKLIRGATGLGLKETRDLVVSASPAHPRVICNGISLDAARALTGQLTEAGAAVSIVCPEGEGAIDTQVQEGQDP